MYSAQMFRDKRKDIINLFVVTEDGRRCDIYFQGEERVMEEATKFESFLLANGCKLIEKIEESDIYA